MKILILNEKVCKSVMALAWHDKCNLSLTLDVRKGKI